MVHSFERSYVQPNLGIAIPALVIAFALTVASAPITHAQTFTVLHTFTGADGATPMVGLTMDKAGNLYGTTQDGGTGGEGYCASACGTVFKLARKGSGWVFYRLYSFKGGSDGAYPRSRVVIGPDSSLYGTTSEGGEPGDCYQLPGCGTVFNLKPSPTRPASVLSPWLETVLYRFQGAPDGSYPNGELAFDKAGNLYGATSSGGAYGHIYSGTIFALAPSNGGWTESILYSFQQAEPNGVTSDSAGNLYGTTLYGGNNDSGTVFQLAWSEPGWTLNTLHDFNGDDGYSLFAGVIFDNAGNLYGATLNSQPNGDALVFELTPSNGGWTYNVLHHFAQSYGGGPAASLVMDAAGNLYGTTRGAAYTNNPFGSVFKLTPSNGGWIYADLHDFTGGADGGAPYSSLVLDAQGNIYGTASQGGSSQNCPHGCGVVFEITP